jgi:hypothetical protein
MLRMLFSLTLKRTSWLVMLAAAAQQLAQK